MWLIVSGDGDIAYTHAYGPYDTESAATAALPEDNDDIRWAIITLEDPVNIVYDPELINDDDTTAVAITPTVTRVQYSPAIDALLHQYGTIENIPGPHADVYTYVNNQIQQLKNRITQTRFDQSFFTPEEGQQLAQMLHSIGIDDDAANFADHARYDQEAQQLQVQIMFLEELARKHRPRAGF